MTIEISCKLIIEVRHLLGHFMGFASSLMFDYIAKSILLSSSTYNPQVMKLFKEINEHRGLLERLVTRYKIYYSAQYNAKKEDLMLLFYLILFKFRTSNYAHFEEALSVFKTSDYITVMLYLTNQFYSDIPEISNSVFSKEYIHYEIVIPLIKKYPLFKRVGHEVAAIAQNFLEKSADKDWDLQAELDMWIGYIANNLKH